MILNSGRFNPTLAVFQCWYMMLQTYARVPGPLYS